MIPNRTAAKTGDPRPVNIKNIVVFGEVCLTTGTSVSGVPTSPTLSSGAGVPTHVRPNGSVYMRTDGAADTTIYSRVSGAWLAVEVSGGDIHIPDDHYVYFGDDDDATIGYSDASDDLTVTIDNGDLNITTTTAGQVVINGVGGLDIDSGNALALDVAGTSAIGLVGAASLTLGAGMDVDGTVEMQDSGVLAFGDDADVTLTHDGTTYVDVAGAGSFRWMDDIGILFGDDSDGAVGYASGVDIFACGGVPVVGAGGGATPASCVAVFQSGPRTVSDATLGPNTGEVHLRTGITNCTDGGGTGGDSGDLYVESGYADSDAGTSGSSGDVYFRSGYSDDVDSGDVIVSSGNAGVDSGDLTLDVGAAGGTPGDVVIGTTANLIATGTTIKPRGQGGADAANALLMGVGTSGDPATTAVDNACFEEHRLQSTSLVGGYGKYVRYEGAGAGGEFIGTRSNTTLSAAAGNAHGSHDTLSFQAGGSVTGLATGRRTGLLIPDRAMDAGGTYYGELIEAYHEGNSSDVTPVTLAAVLGIGVTGDLTGGANFKHMIDFLGPDGGGNIINTGVVATPANTACAISVLVNGVARTLYLY